MKIIRQSLALKKSQKSNSHTQQPTQRQPKQSHLHKSPQPLLHNYLSQIPHKQTLLQYFPSLKYQQFPNTLLIHPQKKHNQLTPGLYILLQGKICYIWTQKSHDLDKKQQLFMYAKAGVYYCYSDPCVFIDNDGDNNNGNINNDDGDDVKEGEKLSKFQSFLLEEKGTIFQCVFQNCFVIQDCVLGKIIGSADNQNSDKLSNNIQISENSNCNDGVNEELYRQFQKIKKFRIDLIENCHYMGERNQRNKLFSVNLNIYSNFRKYQYKFHNRVELNSVGIIASGILKSCKKSTKNNYFQLQKYAILLPGVAYQVISADAQILLIQRNPSLHYNHPELITAHKQLKQNEQTIIKSLHFDRKLKTASCSSLHCRNLSKNAYSHKNKQNNPFIAIQSLTKNIKNWQINNRRKKLTNISKQYQNQLIITMQTCKQSLSFSQKQTSRLHQQNGKYKKPKILFDYSKYCTNKSVKSLHSVLMSMGSMGSMGKRKFYGKVGYDEEKKQEENNQKKGKFERIQIVNKNQGVNAKEERKQLISRTQVLSSMYSKNGQNLQKQTTQRRFRSTYNENSFCRYKNISAELYKKFKKQKERSKINQISNIQIQNI